MVYTHRTNHLPGREEIFRSSCPQKFPLGATPRGDSVYFPVFHDSYKDRRGTSRRSSFCVGAIMAREFARQFYSSKVWQDCRNEYAKSAHYLCEDCLKRGVYRPGIEVHHIEELTPMNIHKPEVTLNFANLVLLCRECHKARHDTRQRDRRYVIGSNGEIIVGSPLSE